MATVIKIKDRDLAGKSAMTGEVESALMRWVTNRIFKSGEKRIGAAASFNAWAVVDIKNKIGKFLEKPENAPVCREIELLHRQILAEKDQKVARMQKAGLYALIDGLEAQIMNAEAVARKGFFILQMA